MIILASGSPRRRELLDTIGIKYEVIKGEAEEITTKSEPHDIVDELSYNKAREVFDKLTDDKKKENFLLIAADTLVFLNNERMGKPKDKADAVNMLSRLSGNTHQVITGVTIIYSENGEFKEFTFNETTAVSFYPIAKDDIVSYVESGEPMDKAGAYAIQTGFVKNIKGINGEYSNVVGLPVARLYQEIRNRCPWAV